MLERMVAIGDPTFRAAFEAQFLKLIQKLCSSPNIAPVRASAWVGVNEKYGPGCGSGCSWHVCHLFADNWKYGSIMFFSTVCTVVFRFQAGNKRQLPCFTVAT